MVKCKQWRESRMSQAIIKLWLRPLQGVGGSISAQLSVWNGKID